MTELPDFSVVKALQLALKVNDELFQMVESADCWTAKGHQRIDDLRTMHELAAEPMEVRVV